MIRLSDYIASFLVARGVQNVYLVSGGGIMHIIDAVGREPRLRYVCNHHEQASAIAAESEARATGRTGVCIATTGPGATNALSGAVGAFYDSVPLLVITGQVRTQVISDYTKLRQLGPQEVNIIDMARPVTKYAVTVKDPTTIRAELEKAWYMAREGRPGPAWLDIPLDVQSAMIDETALAGFEPPAVAPPPPSTGDAARIAAAIDGAKRPLFLVGNGVHLGGGEAAVRSLVEHLGVPTVATIGAPTLLPEEHPLFFGRVGPLGQRRANFALQNSDLLVCFGASLCLASIGFNTEQFAPGAKKYLVNVDPGELGKSTIRQEPGVLADAGAFARALEEATAPGAAKRARWLAACADWKARYPLLTQEYGDAGLVSPYIFASVLGSILEPGETVVTGNSMNWWALYHSFPAKEGQRLYTNLNYGAMGWDLPAAIGACVGRGRRRTVLVTGDGGIQTNLHELGTIEHNQLPIKIFVLSNDGYQSIRATQDNFFGGLHVGSSRASGVSTPNFELLAATYRLRYARIEANEDIERVARAFLAEEGPGLCELVVSPKHERMPRVRSYRKPDGQMASPALEDMYPQLPAEEVAENMRPSREDW